MGMNTNITKIGSIRKDDTIVTATLIYHPV